MTTPFSSLDDFVALPRLSGLVLNREGTRLVTSVATLNAKKTAYRTALWEVDPAGHEPARRLTRSSAGESGAAFLAGGDLLFTSSRPDPDDADGEKRPALWRLPATGGEAALVLSREGGVAGVSTADAAEVVVVTGSSLAGSANEEDDAERRKARKEAGVAAILHRGTRSATGTPTSALTSRGTSGSGAWRTATTRPSMTSSRPLAVACGMHIPCSAPMGRSFSPRSPSRRGAVPNARRSSASISRRGSSASCSTTAGTTMPRGP